MGITGKYKGILLVLAACGWAGCAVAGNGLPHPEALGPWQEDTKIIESPAPWETLPRLALPCGEQELYPTHPQQTLKRYLLYAYAQYDNQKLSGHDEPCLVHSPRSDQRPLPCLRADVAYHVVLSDTYQDACGNGYRGVWELYFLGQQDNMGTLLSLGRSLQPRPGSDLANDFVAGGTYAVPASSFLFLTPLFPGDRETMEKDRQEALSHFHFDGKKRVFIPD
jgi:hypothetical protein